MGVRDYMVTFKERCKEYRTTFRVGCDEIQGHNEGGL
jgi:hypothetical protein